MTPTPAAEAPGSDGFLSFAREVEAAVSRRDGAFFAQRGVEQEVTCASSTRPRGACVGKPAGSVLRGIPQSLLRVKAPPTVEMSPRHVYAGLLRDWFISTRSDLSDDYGSGAPVLYAIAHRKSSGPSGDTYEAVLTDIYTRRGVTARQARVLSFQFLDGGWRLMSETSAAEPEAAAQLLSPNTCRGCYDYWQRWGGVAQTQPPTPATTSITSITPPPIPGTLAFEGREYYESFLTGRGLKLVRYEEADVTGDGLTEALVSASAEGCGSCHAEELFVMSEDVILFSSNGDDAVMIPLPDHRGFQVERPLRLAGSLAQPPCCPSWAYVQTYRWDRLQFVQDTAVSLKTVAADGAPAAHIATVALFYTLLDHKEFPQAYGLLSEAFRAEYPFQTWVDGYSATISISVSDLRGVREGPIPQVYVALQASDRAAYGGTVSRRFSGIWWLVQEDGQWRLDDASIAGG